MTSDLADPRLACALADVPVPTVVLDADGIVTSANPLATELLGPDLAGGPLAAVLTSAVPAAPDGSRFVTWRAEARKADGVPFLLDASATYRPDGSAVVVLRPVPGRIVLAEAQRHLDAAFDTAPIGMAFFDTEGRYVRVNHALCELLGRRADELLGRRDSELTHPDDRQSDVDAAWRILRGEIDVWQTEKRFVRPGGEIVWAIANMTFLRDDERRPLTWLGQFQDITARKALEAQLRGLAGEDPLTGLANRRRLDEALRDALALAARHGHGGALIYVDLTGFKAVNDRFGHDTGDAVLRCVAAAMQERCRTTDTVARLGGDEFAVLLPIATPAQARVFQRALQRVLDGISLPVGDTTVHVRSTLGVCLFGPDARLLPAEVIAAADRAMYAARAAA
jgi:diguanylate cyclase (GGDEF)-like protein/PAS domain S-box-containing protein